MFTFIMELLATGRQAKRFQPYYERRAELTRMRT